MMKPNMDVEDEAKYEAFIAKYGYEGHWKLPVLDGLKLHNKLTLIIFFFNTIHLTY